MKTCKIFPALLLWCALLTGVQAANVSEPAGVGTPPPAASVDTFFAMQSQNPYQFFDAPQLASSTSSLIAARSSGIGAELPLGNFLSDLYVLEGFQYIESKSDTAHGIEPNSSQVKKYEAKSAIAEPQTNLLFLVALVALAIAVRRQSPT